jgi:hypothetical protein
MGDPIFRLSQARGHKSHLTHGRMRAVDDGHVIQRGTHLGNLGFGVNGLTEKSRANSILPFSELAMTVIISHEFDRVTATG